MQVGKKQKMKSITIIFASLFLLISCKEIEKKEVIKVEPQTEIADIENSAEIIEPEKINGQVINFSKSVESFIEKVLRENQRKHEFEIINSGIQHLDIFEKTGLHEIVAFSDKRYPKRIEPNYYEHFTLFALKYDDVMTAKKSYNEIKKISQIGKEEFENLSDEEKQRIRRIEGATKPGGMICQKGKYIFSLVETCRNTPIGGKWKEYENLFLSFITEVDEEIMILNANCGQIKYIEEKRKPVHNNG